MTQDKRRGLKRQFGHWAIRREDVTFALTAWNAYRKIAQDTPDDGQAALVTLTAFVTAYGRIFTGATALKSAPEPQEEGDTELHAHLMELRMKATAHSDYEYRNIRLIPPGAASDGIPAVPAHQTRRWRWLLQALVLRAEHDHVERWLRHLQWQYEERTEQAWNRLLEELAGEILPSTETNLHDLGAPPAPPDR